MPAIPTKRETNITGVLVIPNRALLLLLWRVETLTNQGFQPKLIGLMLHYREEPP
jgi:hypothetical protein